MKLMNAFLGSSLILLILMTITGISIRSEPLDKRSGRDTEQAVISESIRRQFRGLRTNLRKHSIDLNLILDGGPGKDGIPALNNPRFTGLNQAKLSDEMLGILIEREGDQRYYPYNILVWHEIVNDSFKGLNIVVTFCPLCGSAIVFNRRVRGNTLEFGVSGKLYESNLLMYDKTTESLWSQSMGEAVVGDFTGSKLELVPMQVLRFDELKSKYPRTQVLSEETGYVRDYSHYPYGDYERTEKLFFPVSIQDKRFPAKEIMYVFNLDDKSVAFRVKGLGSKISEKVISGRQVAVAREGGEITVSINGKVVPGYYEMWFSWATHHQKNGIVWEMKQNNKK